MIKVVNVRLSLGYNEEYLLEAAAEALKISKDKIAEVKLQRRGIENSDKENLHFKAVLLVSLKLKDEEDHIAYIRRNKGASMVGEPCYNTPICSVPERPVIVGFGPAGIFSALILAEAGARPIVLERGQDVDSRIKDITLFQDGGALLPESNIQFGEGGAGTFSDGKLKTGLVDSRKYKILSELVLAGAPENILYLEKPHIGSDILRKVVKNLREKIINLGGEVHFSSRVVELKKNGDNIFGIKYIKNGEIKELDCHRVILAIGHSARDTFKYLNDFGLKMEQKGFGLGVRIEHPQGLINTLQYGKFAGNKNLGAADYKLVTHLKNGRSVYTFCMCPGGYVVGAASEENRICTNGMSEFSRGGENANTAMLVSVTPKDFGSDHPLAGIEYQRKIESEAFMAGGGNYFAPVQRLEDFMEDRKSVKLGSTKPTYLPGTTLGRVDDFLPSYITESLRLGLDDMFKWLPGYYCPDSVLTGPETRTTSPVRIIRGNSLEAEGTKGLYPCGEGAGYAGGIISAAVDGIRCAESILSNYTG